jgi:hypothetical protein
MDTDNPSPETVVTLFIVSPGVPENETLLQNGEKHKVTI